MRPEEKPKRQIGFRVDEQHVKYSVNKLKKKLLINRLLKKLFSCLCEERSDEAISLFKQKMRLLRDETARRDTLLCVFQQPAKTF
jgi:hypothetical protein